MGKVERQPVTMIAVDPALIERLATEVAALRAEIRGATIKPRDEWESIETFAARVGRTVQTVRLWVRQGKVESKRIGGVLLIRG